jgi:hypothetical protein
MRYHGLRSALVVVALVFAFFIPPLARAQNGLVEIDVKGGSPGESEGTRLVFHPIPLKKGAREGTVGKDGKLTKDLPSGIYLVLIQLKRGGAVLRWIRIENGKRASISIDDNDIPPGFDPFPSRADAALVERINKAARECNGVAYENGKKELENIRRELQAELDELEKLVKEESENTGLPDNEATLTEMLGTRAGSDEAKAPVDPVQKAKLEDFEVLVRNRDSTRASLKKVEAELAALLPLQPCPPKAAETPPPKPEEKPPMKPSDNKEGR